MLNVATLGLSLDSSGMRAGLNDLKQVETAGKRAADALDDAGVRGARSMNSLRSGFSALQTAVAALGLGAAIKQVASISDEYANITGRLKLVTSGTEELRQVQDSLFEVAQRTGSAYADTATLYTRVAQNAKDLGLSQQQLIQFTETTAQAFQVSGASALEASGAIRQLTQGLAAGALRGEEFNSIAENGPRIMEALAASLGVTRGELREMAADGKLTAEVVVEAMRSQARTIEGEFSQLPITVGRAMTELENEVKRAIAGADVSPLTDSIRDLTKIMSDPATVKALATLSGGLISAAGFAANAAAGFAELGNEIGYFAAFATGSLTDADKLQRQIERIKAALALDPGLERMFFAAAEFAEKSNAELEKEVRIYEGLLARIKKGSSIGLSLEVQRGLDAAAGAIVDINKLLPTTSKGVEGLASPLREASAEFVPFKSATDKAAAATGGLNKETALSKDQLKAQADAAKAAAKEADALAEAFDDLQASIRDAIDDRNASSALTKELENQLYFMERGLSLEDARTAATLNTLQVHARMYALMGDQVREAEALAEIERIGLQRRIAGVQESRDASVAAAAEQVETAKRAADEISRSLTDALLRGFESGKDIADNFFETLKNTAAALVLRPVIEFVLSPLSTVLGSIAGGGSGGLLSTLLGGSGGGVGSALSSILGGGVGLAQGAQLGFMSGGIVGAAQGFADAALTTLGEGIANIGAQFGSAGVQSFGSGLSSSAAGFGQVLGPAVLGYFGGSTVARVLGLDQSGQTGAGIGGALGAGIGSIVPGIGTLIGGAIGTALGGLVGSAFGGGSWKMDDVRLSGDFAGADFDGALTQYNSKKLSMGRGRRRRQVELDATGLEDALSEIFGGVFVEATNSAGALGLSVRDFTYSVDESLKGLEGAELEAKIVEIVSGAADSLAGQILPGLESFQREGESLYQTLGRVSAQTVAVESSLEKLGVAGLVFEQIAQSADEANVSGGIFSQIAGNIADQLQQSEQAAQAFARIDLAQQLVDAAGGFEKFAANVTAYIDAFFTEPERFGLLQQNLESQIGATGLGVLPDTREGYRLLVEGLDVTSEAGREAYTVLTSLAGVADQYYDTLEKNEKDRQGLLSDVNERIRELTIPAEELARLRLDESFAELYAEFERLDLDSAIIDPLYQLELAALSAGAAIDEFAEQRSAFDADFAQRLARQGLSGQGLDEFDLAQQYEADLAEAQRIGADINAVEAYYAAERLRIVATYADQAIADAQATAAEAARIAEEEARKAIELAQRRASLLGDVERELADFGLEGLAADLQSVTREFDRRREEFIAAGLDTALLDQLESVKREALITADALRQQEAATADAARAEEELARERERVTGERLGLERQLLEVMGDTAALRALDRAALDESNRALFDQIHALRESQAATEAAAQAESDLAAERNRISQEREGLERQLLEVLGDTAALRELDRLALDESNRALYDQIQGIRDQQAAATLAQEAANALAEAQAEAARQAEELARAEAQLSADRAAFTNDLQDQITRAGLSGESGDVFDLDLQFERVREEAKQLGVDLTLVERLYGIRRSEIAQRYADEAADEAERIAADLANAQREAAEATAELVRAEQELARNRAAFADDIQSQITRAGLSGQAGDIFDLDRQFDQIREEAESLGVDLVLVEKLYGIRREEIAERYAEEAEQEAQAAADRLLDIERQLADERAGIASERAALERQLLEVQGNTAALRALDRKELDASNRSLFDQINRLRDQKEAASAAAEAARELSQAVASAGDAITDEVNRLRGLSGGQQASVEQLQAQFGLATSMARSGNLDALNELPTISRALEEAAATNAVTAFDVDRTRSYLASSLQETLSRIGISAPVPLPSFASVAPQSATSFQPQSGSNDSAAIVRAIEALRVDQKANTKAITTLQTELNTIAKRWDFDGLPEERETA